MNPVESQGGKRKRSLSDDAPPPLPSTASTTPGKLLLSVSPLPSSNMILFCPVIISLSSDSSTLCFTYPWGLLHMKYIVDWW
jgi:hypothetical protein